MAQILNHPELGEVSFPNEYSQDQINNWLVQADALMSQQYGALNTVTYQTLRSMTSSLRGLGEMAGFDMQDEEDLEAERKSRIMFEQSPWLSITGMLGGAILDPVTLPAAALKPLTFASKAATYGSRGAAHGLVGGAVEPVYEEFGDSQLANTVVGTIFGGALGAGIGKLTSKKPLTDVPEQVAEAPTQSSEQLQAASKKAISDVLTHVDEPSRTTDQVLTKLKEELELEAKGAPTKEALLSEQKVIEGVQREANATRSLLEKIGEPRLGMKKQHATLAHKLDGLEKQASELEATHATNKTKRKAVETLEKVAKGRFSQLPDIQERMAQLAKPLPKTPIAQAVGGQLPKIDPISPRLANTLGIGDPFPTMHRSVGAAAQPKAKLVGEDLLPRAREAETRKVVEGTYKGKSDEASVTVKPSRKTEDAVDNFNRKQARGEKLTEKDYDDLSEAENELKELAGYKKTLNKLASANRFDTASLRGIMKGRYTFDNIAKNAKALLKNHNIEDIEDMVDYILSNKGRILDATEMEMLAPLLREVERKLFRVHSLLEHSDTLTDAEIALLHSDINMYYGIQAWFKGQGTRVSAALNHRRKMLRDIAEGREIDSLFAGVKC